MRKFEIVSTLGRRKKPVGWLLYDQEAHTATMRIAPDARCGHVPAMFNRFIEQGEHDIDAVWTLRWIGERIPPSSRMNIGEILDHAGLDDYDPYELLLVSQGRSSQDDFFLREVGEAESASVEYHLVTLESKLGQRIAAARRDAGMTQQELSYRTGIQQATISRIERGKGNPTIETLDCIARELGLTLEVGFR